MNNYPGFVEDSVFYNMDSEQAFRDQQTAMLNNLKVVFDLTNHSYKTLDELVKDYLLVGSRIFQLETGIVSHIDDDVYTVVDVTSNQDVIAKGDEYPLEGTYCREVFHSNKVLGFPHVGALPFMRDHPVYVNMKLEAYLSAPIEVDGELYGTLNFTSTEKRENGFSQHERDLISLMAQAIGNFLLLRDREQHLNDANVQLKKFVGFVAHDLRGPLGSIKALAKMGSKKETPTDRLPKIMEKIDRVSGVTLDFVHSVLEVSALGSGKIEPALASVDINSVFELAEDSLSELLNARRCSIVFPEKKVSVKADKNLIAQVVNNLLMNAVKYSPAGGEISVDMEKSGSEYRVTIKNHISESQEDLNSTSNYRSVGFGLEIATQILLAHGSELHLSKNDDIFTANFSISAA